MVDGLDPCLIFLPGEPPDDFGRINGGSVDIPDDTDEGGEIIIKRRRFPPVPPGGPPTPGPPTREPRQPPRPPPPPDPLVWICVNGIVSAIRLSAALASGINWYTTKAMALAACEDPPVALVWVCRNGVPVQIPLNQIIPNEPFFTNSIQASQYCIDPQIFMVWVCRNGRVEHLPWVYLAPGEPWYTSYAAASVGCIETREPSTGPTETEPQVPDTTNTGDEEGDGPLPGTAVTDITGISPETTGTGDTGGGVTRTRVTGIDQATPTGYQYGDQTSIPQATNFIDSGYYPAEYGSNTSLELNNQNQIAFLQSQVDSSIITMIDGSRTSIAEINRSLYRIVSPLIKESVKTELAEILYNLYTPDGRKVQSATIDKSLQIRAINGTLGQVQLRYILALATRSAINSANKTVRQAGLAVTSTFGNSRSDIAKSRMRAIRQLNKVRAGVESISPDENRAVSRAFNNLISLNAETYSGASKELLKLWYVLPEDIYATVTLETSSGTSSFAKITNKELVSVTTSDGSIQGIPVNQYKYDIPVITSAGTELVIINSEIERAYTLNNAVEMACLYDSNAAYRINFTVSSPASSNLELSYDLSSSLQPYYVFKLNKNTIEDIPNDVSPFVRKTEAQYTIVTGIQEINDAIKFRIYPWKVLPIDYNDPIFGHFGDNSTYTFQYTSFGFEEFGDDINGPILVRKVPNVVIVVPTDRYDYNLFAGQSTLTDWNTRSLNFTLSPDPQYHDRNLRNHYFANISLAYPDTGVTSEITESGLKATFVSSAPGITETYSTGTMPTRTQHGFRAAVNITSALNDAYVTRDGLSWTDVFVRMNKTEYSNYKIGIPDKMIDRFRLGEKGGIKLYHPKGNNTATQSRLLYLKPGKTDPTQIKLDIQYASNTNSQ